jgi:hypothetical protein
MQTIVPVDFYKYSSGVMCRINLSLLLTGEHSASQFRHSNNPEFYYSSFIYSKLMVAALPSSSSVNQWRMSEQENSNIGIL